MTRDRRDKPVDPTSLEFGLLLLAAAQSHGENSEPDHEVGDLQTIFQACWSVMTPEQRAEMLSAREMRELLDGPEFEELFS